MDTPIATAPAEPPRKRRWWVGALVASFALLVLFACGASTVLLLRMTGDAPSAFDGDAVALIHIDTVISGTAGSEFDVSSATPENIIYQLERASDDDSVKAVLLRIDSPGGTASASQEIAAEVARMDKPVVASIGDVGASGAYMIAAQCDHVMASPFSAVGSIGVISEFPNIAELADKLGIKVETITRGKYKDAGNVFRDLTAEERAMIEDEMDAVYDEFIRDVARGRDMSEPEVRKLATGWVWNGRKAKELGLVDSIGNYSDAVDKAADEGGIDGDPRIVTYVEPAFSDLFGELVGVLSQFGGVDAGKALKTGPPLVR